MLNILKRNRKLGRLLLDNADHLYVNSDAHLLSDLRDARNEAFQLLKQMKYIK